LECGDLSPLFFRTATIFGRLARATESGDKSPHSKRRTDSWQAFPAQAVLGPCLQHGLVGRGRQLLPFFSARRPRRAEKNGRAVWPDLPDVNVGPIIAIAKQTRDKIEPYAILPWWVCCSITKVGKVPWSTKALVAVVMARLASLKAAADCQGDQDTDEEWIGAIENMGGDDRFSFSLDWLTATQKLPGCY
jgi:hypothetical protein